MKFKTLICNCFFSILISFIFFACVSSQSSHYRSSVVDYLYPEKKDPIETVEIPTLSLPIRVGIAFVPEVSGYNQNLSEKDKMELMKEISKHFKKYDFVKSIEIIPTIYLRPYGSFPNLDQIRTMFAVDVIALISYDLAQFTDEGLASITYWTLIGKYIVPGEKNDTHTMVDAAVYDIESRKMLFRAPGISHTKSHATPVNLTEQLRADSLQGFRQASEDLIVNLDEQLQQFRANIRESQEDIKVTYKPGYTGGGSLDVFFITLVVILNGLRLWELKCKKM